jgi:hypothetical protein
METTYPQTSNGKEIGEWARVLERVLDDAKDAYGFHGKNVRRGCIADVKDGAVVLECAGYRSVADQRSSKRLMALWVFSGGSWYCHHSTTSRGWALDFRKEAQALLGGG